MMIARAEGVMMSAGQATGRLNWLWVRAQGGSRDRRACVG